MLLFLVTRFTETQPILNLQALKIKTLVHEYGEQFKNRQLLAGGLLMGSTTSFVYVFAALAPFIAINMFGMNSAQYGIFNILPPFGLAMGGLVSAQLTKIYSLQTMIRAGIVIICAGVIAIFPLNLMHFPILYSLFLPMMFVYFGLCFIMASASTLGMSHVTDKAHGSAVMNFINVGMTTIIVLSLGLFSIKVLLLPTVYLGLCVMMLIIYKWAMREVPVENTAA
jgi:DHA1 family bicyclomycin/chloramphenicol resistance-like MFS transporter